MIDERVKLLEAAAGVGQQTFWNHMKRHNIPSPISHQDFVQMARKIASSPRLESKLDVKQRILSLTLPDKFEEVISSERIHQPFLRKEPDNTNRDQTQPKPLNNSDLNQTRQQINTSPDLSVSSQTRPSPASQPKSISSGLTYAQTAGNTIRKMNAFIKVLMFISAMGVSYTLFTVGCAFFSDPYIQIALGALSVWAAWAWEGALKAQTNTFMHQWIYRLWDGRGDFILACIVLLTMLAPNIYQGVVAAGKLSNLAAPIHIEDDGSGINNKLIKEKEAIAADYERTREALKQEQESAALADPNVAKFADYETSEIQNAKAIRNVAEARRREAEKYRAKGEKANANWCLHLANEEEKKAKKADSKAEAWRAKKEQASAAVYASYTAKFTELNKEEQAKKAQADNRYEKLLITHGKTESQRRAQSERQNEGIMWIGFIFLPVADFVVLLLVFFMVKYYYRTGQVDPTLKEYKVGEKSKLQQFLSGVVGPAWDTVFGQVLRVGYHYQAMAQASLDRAEFVKKLKAEEAELRVQQYEQRIAQRIAELKG